MEQNRNVIGANLRRLRVAKDFSQERLSVQCARLGYEFPRGTLAKIEAGIRAVSDVELFVLSHALTVALTEFFPDSLLRRLKAGDVKPFHVRKGGQEDADSRDRERHQSPEPPRSSETRTRRSR
jgi:transcriptional regulator with XRE-family HTH domain